MKLNCKPGDLAVIVQSLRGNDGLMVTCLRRYDGPWRDAPDQPGWEIDRLVLKIDGKKSKFVPDKYLRPIRDNPGQDETLIYAGLPGEKVTA